LTLDGIRSLDFGEDTKSIDIFAMVSSEGERIQLGKNLKARGNVENWLTTVEQNMVSSLQRY
jgi:dynein heavy chain